MVGNVADEKFYFLFLLECLEIGCVTSRRDALILWFQFEPEPITNYCSMNYEGRAKEIQTFLTKK